MRIRLFSAALAVMVAAGPSLAQSPIPLGSPAGPSLQTDETWADRVFIPGQSPEVCLYDATRVVGFHERTFSVRIEARAETLSRENYAPILPPFSDTPTVDVVTLDWSATIPDVDGGERSERMLLHAQRRDVAAPVKLAVSVLEPGVVLYKTFQFWTLPLREVYHSTRPGEGDGERVIEGTAIPDYPAISEDLMPLLVRSLAFAPGRRYNLRIIASELTDRAEEPRIIEAFLECVEAKNDVEVPAGVFAAKNLRRFELLRADGVRSVYFIETASPNRLILWESNDGRSLKLKQRMKDEF